MQIWHFQILVTLAILAPVVAFSHFIGHSLFDLSEKSQTITVPFIIIQEAVVLLTIFPNI